MTTDSAPLQLRSRIRKYFLVVFGLIGGAVVLLVLLGAAVKLAGVDGKTGGAILGIAAPLLMLGVVGSSWYAVHKLWRCPKCEKSVYWLVSWNFSLFASAAASNCPGCGVELFTVDQKKKTQRRFIILIVLAIGMGLLGGLAAAVTSPRRPPEPLGQQPRPPG